MYQSTGQFTRLPNLLHSIVLKGDTIMEVKQFYNSINMAMMTSVAAMTFFPAYEMLTKGFDPKAHIVPPLTHPQYNDAENAYVQYSNALRLHLQEPRTIDARHAPKASVLRQETSMEECGFRSLFFIITKLSPQLGGVFRDLQEFIHTLKIIEGEPVLDYYLRALRMSAEIILQRDKTGQHNRLILRFVTQLFQIQAFTECMRPTMKEITQFFEDPDNHLQMFHRSIQDIYNRDIKNNCAPLMISAKAKYRSPIQPQIASITAAQISEDVSQVDNDARQLQKPIVRAARLTPGTDHKSDLHTPRQCLACGKTQKEIHECLKNIHDPSDPSKCCFRGSQYLSLKEMKETIKKYNTQHKGESKAFKDVQHKIAPPQQPHLPDPKINQMYVHGQRYEGRTDQDNDKDDMNWIPEGKTFDEWIETLYHPDHQVSINDSSLSKPIVNMIQGSKYTPKRCTVCGKTQKELHQLLRRIHEDNDPDNCCFRGPKYIRDKNIREAVMQYNLKHAGSTSSVQSEGVNQSSKNLPEPKANKINMKHQPKNDDTLNNHIVTVSDTTPTNSSPTQEQQEKESRDESALTAMIRQLEEKTQISEGIEHNTPRVAMAKSPAQFSGTTLPTPEFNMKKVEFPATSQHIMHEEGQDLTPSTPKQHTVMRL